MRISDWSSDVCSSDLDHRNLHFGEIGLADGAPVTSGLYGWTMVVTGCGPTIEESRHAAYARAGRIHIPNMRYRLDIGERLVAEIGRASCRERVCQYV